MSEIRDSIVKLFKVFSGKPNTARINLYCERLQTEKPEHVARAVDKIIDTRKSLPAIADIRELVAFFAAQERSANHSEPELSAEQLEQKRAEALDLCADLHRKPAHPRRVRRRSAKNGLRRRGSRSQADLSGDRVACLSSRERRREGTQQRGEEQHREDGDRVLPEERRTRYSGHVRAPSRLC
jgi:hypothetical protein